MHSPLVDNKSARWSSSSMLRIKDCLVVLSSEQNIVSFVALVGHICEYLNCKSRSLRFAYKLISLICKLLQIARIFARTIPPKLSFMTPETGRRRKSSSCAADQVIWRWSMYIEWPHDNDSEWTAVVEAQRTRGILKPKHSSFPIHLNLSPLIPLMCVYR